MRTGAWSSHRDGHKASDSGAISIITTAEEPQVLANASERTARVQAVEARAPLEGLAAAEPVGLSKSHQQNLPWYIALS